MALIEVFSRTIPKRIVEVRDYEVLLVHLDGTKKRRLILARNSVDAIQLVLRAVHGDVVALTCKVVA